MMMSSCNSVAQLTRIQTFKFCFVLICKFVFQSQPKLTPQERLKKKMQALLNRQCKCTIHLSCRQFSKTEDTDLTQMYFSVFD